MAIYMYVYIYIYIGFRVSGLGFGNLDEMFKIQRNPNPKCAGWELELMRFREARKTPKPAITEKTP